MSLAGHQINPIDVNFHLQKSLKILGKIQLTKSNPKRTEGGKYPASCQLGLRDIESNLVVSRQIGISLVSYHLPEWEKLQK